MQDNQNRSVFWKIVKASVTNIAGFGLATALVGYLFNNSETGTPVMVLAGVVVFIMLVSLSSLLMFIGYTLKGMPDTMAKKPVNKSFIDIYNYILAALAVRIAEAAICIIYIVYIYNLYF